MPNLLIISVEREKNEYTNILGQKQRVKFSRLFIKFLIR